jgi:hypothetical protein
MDSPGQQLWVPTPKTELHSAMSRRTHHRSRSRRQLVLSFGASALCYLLTAGASSMWMLYASRVPTVMQHAVLAARTVVTGAPPCPQPDSTRPCALVAPTNTHQGYTERASQNKCARAAP